MKILMPTHAFTDQPKSGLHTAIWNTARSLGEAGHEVHVVSTWTELSEVSKQSLVRNDVHIHTVADFPVHNLNRIIALRCFFAAVPLMKKKRFDWIYIIDTAKTPFHEHKFGAKIAIRLLAPNTDQTDEIFKGEDWNYDRQRKDAEEGWEERRKPLWYRLCSLLLIALDPVLFPKDRISSADLGFCQGNDTLDHWKKRLSIPLIQLPNGIETSAFEHEGEPPRKTDRFTFLFVGRIAKRKGVFHLLDAFARLRKTVPDTELWLVGKGSEELNKELDDRIAQDPDHIHCFGEVDRSSIARFFHHCDCLVDPMIYQGFSSVVLEALYCGKPVIASRFGGTKDIVHDGKNGRLIDVRDVSQLSDAMHDIRTEHEHFVATVKEEHENLVKKYDWKAVAAILTKGFEST